MRKTYKFVNHNAVAKEQTTIENKDHKIGFVVPEDHFEINVYVGVSFVGQFIQKNIIFNCP